MVTGSIPQCHSDEFNGEMVTFLENIRTLGGGVSCVNRV